MTIRTRLVLDNCCYHITTRGNQRQKVFIRDEDYEKYLEKLKKYKRKYHFRLYGYCLMPNHIHLIGEIDNKENLAKFMQGINRAYTAYFNKTYRKVGHLWQGRFNSKIITKDEYLITSINYIELVELSGKKPRGNGRISDAGYIKLLGGTVSCLVREQFPDWVGKRFYVLSMYSTVAIPY